MSGLQRPRPIIGVYEKPFWDRVQERELALQRCARCAHVWFPPGPVCPACLADDWRFERMSGRGRVVAWTVFHRQYFKEIPVPYAVVSVQLDEGPLLVGNLPGVDAQAIRLDMPVSVTFEAVAATDGEWLIYQWQPA
jgi:uncharacterized protein